MLPGGLALLPPQSEGTARKEAASYQAGETISKPLPPSHIPSRNTCKASIAGCLS